VEDEPCGIWINYKLSGSARNEYANVILKHLAGWLNEDEQILQDRVRVSYVNREKKFAVVRSMEDIYIKKLFKAILPWFLLMIGLATMVYLCVVGKPLFSVFTMKILQQKISMSW